jgi:hypothetical protein
MCSVGHFSTYVYVLTLTQPSYTGLAVAVAVASRSFSLRQFDRAVLLSYGETYILLLSLL